MWKKYNNWCEFIKFIKYYKSSRNTDEFTIKTTSDEIIIIAKKGEPDIEQIRFKFE